MTKLLIVVSLLAVGCRDRADTNEQPKYTKSSETAHDDFDSTRKTFSTHANERLRRLDERIHELAARGTAAARRAADELRSERDRLAPKLDDIGRQAKAGWDRFETEMTDAFDALEKKLDAAFAD